MKWAMLKSTTGQALDPDNRTVELPRLGGNMTCHLEQTARDLLGGEGV